MPTVFIDNGRVAVIASDVPEACAAAIGDQLGKIAPTWHDTTDNMHDMVRTAALGVAIGAGVLDYERLQSIAVGAFDLSRIGAEKEHAERENERRKRWEASRVRRERGIVSGRISAAMPPLSTTPKTGETK